MLSSSDDHKETLCGRYEALRRDHTDYKVSGLAAQTEEEQSNNSIKHLRCQLDPNTSLEQLEPHDQISKLKATVSIPKHALLCLRHSARC